MSLRASVFLRPILAAAGIVIMVFAASAASAESGRAIGNVNMRECPGTYCARILTIPIGALVEILGRQGSWYEVEYRSRRGFAYSRYIALVVPYEPYVYEPYVYEPYFYEPFPTVPRRHYVRPQQHPRQPSVKPREPKRPPTVKPREPKRPAVRLPHRRHEEERRHRDDRRHRPRSCPPGDPNCRN